MKIFITTGTPEFMEKLQEKFSAEKLFIMYGASHSILLHETEGKTLFQTPRRYEVIGSYGNFEEVGYFVFNHIPVTDEGRPVFEHHFKNHYNILQKRAGFIAFRLLRPLGSDTYIILTEWKDAFSFNQWKATPEYGRVHATETSGAGVDRAAHLFSSAPYITTYQKKKNEEKA
ncbi:antibiotic biosynthesis monooxygenase [Sporosarcina sp. HYO08]|uniref:antibiotic biosynthesis monooxygenase family protein n=1 Tax=Sporosarcina sp. HYO08 TaxID=1759557 RepID=UPI000797322E|nr:antibiotic biosynthesis monooxygenase [Sporosarcina sp. HYO08]KXH84122.1 signal transduction protein TRAP [Sporosarcina sp. HYO08]